MPQRIKKLQNKIWNLINILITIIGVLLPALIAILIVWLTSPSTRELSLLKTENEKFQREINNLKDEIDPNWHKKFNEQKQYYVDELTTKNNTLYQAEKKIDSILLNHNTTKNTKNQILLPTKEVRRNLNRLAKADYESVDLILVKQELEAYKELNKIRDTLIKAKDTLIKNQRLSIDVQDGLIKNLNASIEIYDLIIKNYENTGVKKLRFWGLTLISFLVILLFLSVLFLMKKEKFSTSN